MTDPTQSVHIRRVYYASGTPPVLPVLYDDSYDALPNVDVLDPVLQYDGQLAVQGYTWNGTRQTINSGGGDPIGDALRADAVAYWDMDENGGNRIDGTGNGHDGVPTTGTVTESSNVAGKVNQASPFDGSESDYLNLNNIAGLKTYDNNFTYISWLKFNSFVGLAGQIFSLISSDEGFDADFFIYTDAASKILKFGITGNDISYPEVAATTFGEIPTGDFIFTVTKFVKGSGLYISINNGDFDFAAYALSNKNVVIGENSYYRQGSNFIGAIDISGLWFRELTAEEIAYLYNSGAGRTLYP